MSTAVVQTLPLEQPQFANALLAPDARAPVGIKAANQHERERRFSVHRNNVVVGLVDALADSFPVTQALVGTQFFRAMARERVLVDPPRSPILFEYVHGLPYFVAGFAPAASIPYLVGVARIEAMRVRAYHAADAEPVGPARFHELGTDPERLARTRVTLHPACRYFSSRHAAHAVWAAHQGLSDMTLADMRDIDTNAAEDILVTRNGFDIPTATLPPGGIAFLDALRAGSTLADAVASAQSRNTAANPGALFSILIEFDLAVGLDNEPE